jgi:hypothetical protein
MEREVDMSVRDPKTGDPVKGRVKVETEIISVRNTSQRQDRILNDVVGGRFEVACGQTVTREVSRQQADEIRAEMENGGSLELVARPT